MAQIHFEGAGDKNTDDVDNRSVPDPSLLTLREKELENAVRTLRNKAKSRDPTTYSFTPEHLLSLDDDIPRSEIDMYTPSLPPSSFSFPPVDSNDSVPPPSPPPPPPSPRAIRMGSLLKEWKNFSPETQAAMHSMMGNTLSGTSTRRAPPAVPGFSITPVISATSAIGPGARKLFSSEAESQDIPSIGNFDFGPHPLMVNRVEHRMHAPLSMFTNEAIRRMHIGIPPIPVITKHVPRDDGTTQKIQIHDIAAFKPEERLDFDEWTEGSKGWLKFLKTRADPAVYERWLGHEDFLTSQPNIRRNFPAILRFDIEQRTAYALHPRVFDGPTYLARFQEIKLELLQEAAPNANSWPSQQWNTNPPSVMYPYAAPPSFFPPPPSLAPSWAPSNTFGGGADRSKKGKERAVPYAPADNFPRPSGNSSVSTPICLICGKANHKFSACVATAETEGKQVYASYVGKNLVQRSNPNNILCVRWNLNSAALKCSSNHADRHRCSFCGSVDHPACSRSC